MNKPLSLILLAKMGAIDFIDKKSGIVQVLEKVTKTPEGLQEKRIPFSTIATIKDIQQPDTTLVDMVPDSRFKGILYFEDRGIRPGVTSASVQEYNSDLRLVCWLNTKLISGEVMDMSLAPVAMQDLISRLTDSSFESGVFKLIKVRVISIPQVSPAIFAEYDYDESKTQYLLPPFDYFAIDLSVSFRIAKNCRVSTATPTPILSFPTFTAKTYGDAEFDPGVTSNSPGAISYASSNPSVASIVNGKIKINGAGSVIITATQEATGDYSGTSKTRTLTVAKKSASVVVADKTKIQGSADPIFTGTLSGFLPADNVSAVYSRSTGETPGVYGITATLSPGNVSDNYAVTITAGALTITAPVQAQTFNLFGDQVPGSFNGGGYFANDGSLAVGTKFYPTVNGKILGVRFYRHESDTETGKIGKVWNVATGLALATKAFSESGSGWQEVLFDTPVNVTAGQILMSSYWTPIGKYYASWDYFGAEKPNTSGNLVGVKSFDSINGVFSTDQNAMPNSTNRASNYWADVIFQPD